MTTGQDAGSGPVGTASLVVKRGHHGRFRFALIATDARLTGEVRVDFAERHRDVVRADAIAKIAALARALSASLASRSVLAEAGGDEEPCGGSSEIHLHLAAEKRVDSVGRATGG